MRSKTYWEERLQKALEQLADSQESLKWLNRSLVETQSEAQSKGRKKYRHKRLYLQRRITYFKRLIAKLTATKIPYYESRLLVDDKTVWERILNEVV